MISLLIIVASQYILLGVLVAVGYDDNKPAPVAEDNITSSRVDYFTEGSSFQQWKSENKNIHLLN